MDQPRVAWRGRARLQFRPVYQLASIVLFGVLASGCTLLGPDYVQPEVQEAEEWIDNDEPEIEAESADLSQWWTVFNDPVLNRLVETAANQNLTLQIAGLRILEARARLGIAVGEQYPQVQDATGSFRRTRISDNAPNASFLDRNFSNLFLGLDAAWEIDFWGRFRRGVESADASFGASLAGYDDFLVSLTAEVAAAYVLIREVEERLALAKSNVAIQERTLEIADVRFRNGNVTELDVQQATALLGDTKALIPNLETSLRQTKNALSVLLGMPPSELTDILGGAGSIPTAPTSVALGIPTELLRRRPDIRRAELDAVAQSARIGIAQADLYPRFALAGFIGFNTSDGGGSASNNAELSDLFNSDSLTGSIGPTFSWPIFNYGRLTNNVRVQDARFQQLAINYQESVLRAYQEVEDGLVGFLKAKDETEHLGVSVRASVRSVELSLLQYRQGLIDYIRVLDTQRFQVLQQDRLAASRGAIARNLISTYKALGGGWEIRDPNEVIPQTVQAEMRERTNWGDLLPVNDLQNAPVTADEAATDRPFIGTPDW